MPDIRSVAVTTTGAAGSASGSGEVQTRPARLVAVALDYHATAPATTDVTITPERGSAITLANQNTDRIVVPKIPVQNLSGVDIADEYESPFMEGEITVTVAQSNALSPAVTVRLVLEQ